MHFLHRSKRKVGSLLFKMDLEKAYDSISWDFLRETLIEFGFPMMTVNLILNCVTSNSLSLLWNGERVENIIPTRELHQGDLLSPYLFVLCMERLRHLIWDKVSLGEWKLLQISRNGPTISHIFFADDCLLFTKVKGQVALSDLTRVCYGIGYEN